MTAPGFDARAARSLSCGVSPFPSLPGESVIHRLCRTASLAGLLVACLAGAPTARAAAWLPPALDARPFLETWALPGTAMFVDDAHLGPGLPAHHMGFIVGGLTRRDALVAPQGPWPAIVEAQPPLAWYDSTEVVVGADAGWLGYGASLVDVRTHASAPRTRIPRAAFTTVNGSSGLDRNSILLERGDSRGWLRGGSVSNRHAPVATLGRRGEHLWFVDASRIRGAHRLEANFTQRGAAATTRVDDREVDLIGGVRPPWRGFEESARGESGGMLYEWTPEGRRVSLAVRRSLDHRESFESPLDGVRFVFAERQAQENALVAEADRTDGDRVTGLRLALAQSRVRRSPDFLNTLVARDWRQRSVWLGARHERPLFAGRLEVQAGVGLQSADSRLGLVPAVEWVRAVPGLRARLHAGRQLTPVWSDLAPITTPFTQDAWLAGGELGLGQRARDWMTVSVLGARVDGRARIERMPVRDVTLRYGWVRGEVPVYDGLASLAMGARRGVFAADLSGFARVNPRVAFEALTDPSLGARAGVEAAFHVFQGDLGVVLRLEGAWVGPREWAPLPEYFQQPQPLDGYLTSAGSLMLELGDARFGLRVQNLEDIARPQPWADPSRAFPGTPALGAGRQIRFELAWPFFD